MFFCMRFSFLLNALGTSILVSLQLITITYTVLIISGRLNSNDHMTSVYRDIKLNHLCHVNENAYLRTCLLYTSPSPRDS